MVRLHEVDVSVDAAALIPPSRLSRIRVHENGQHILASFDDVGGVVNADGERGVSAIVVENLLAVQEDVRVSEDALEPEPDRGAGVVGRERELFSVPTLTWGPQGQGVRGVKTMVKSVGDRQIPRLESYGRR